MLRSIVKLCHFCMKKCTDDLSTFVGNEGYHSDEEAKRNPIEPRNDSGDGQRWWSNTRGATTSEGPATTMNSDDLVVGELPSPYSAPFGSFPLALAHY